MLKNKLYLHAQILIITLLILTILAIIVVGVVGLATRDVIQTVANQEYERLYNASENNILRLVDKYADPQVSLSELTTDYGGSCAQGADPDAYICEFVEGDVHTRVEISEENALNEYELGKDESVEIVLDGFRGDVSMTWVGTAGMEYALIYQEGNKYGAIYDVFDLDTIYDSNGGDPYTTPLNHAFPFENDPAKGAGWIKFRVGNITGLPVTATTKSLRITARQRDETGLLAKIDVTGSVGFPDQVREILATSFKPSSDTNIAATARTVIPVLSQSVSALYYALATKDVVDKPNEPCNVMLAIDEPMTRGAWKPLYDNFMDYLPRFHPITIQQDIFPVVPGDSPFLPSSRVTFSSQFINGYNSDIDLIVISMLNDSTTYRDLQLTTYIQDHVRRGFDVLIYGDDFFSTILQYLYSLGRWDPRPVSLGHGANDVLATHLAPGARLEYGGVGVGYDTSFIGFTHELADPHPLPYANQFKSEFVKFQCQHETDGDFYPPTGAQFESGICVWGEWTHSNGARVNIIGGIGGLGGPWVDQIVYAVCTAE